MLNVKQVGRLGTDICEAIAKNCTRSADYKALIPPRFRLNASALEGVPDELHTADIFTLLRRLEGQPLGDFREVLDNPFSTKARGIFTAIGIDRVPQELVSHAKPLFDAGEDLVFKQSKGIGDCYLLSSLYSAWRNPEGRKTLENMIKMTNDGYEVVFKGHPQQPITVKFSEIEGQMVDGTKKVPVEGCDGLKIIERAYGKLRKARMGQASGKSLKIVESGHQQDFLLDLFGNKAASVRIASDTNTTATLDTSRKLVEQTEDLLGKFAQNPNKYVLGCYTPLDPIDPKQSCYWFQFSRGGQQQARLTYNAHAYSIKDVDPAKKIIHVVNPHNTSEVSEYTYEEFFKVFRGIKGVSLPSA